MRNIASKVQIATSKGLRLQLGQTAILSALILFPGLAEKRDIIGADPRSVKSTLYK